MFKFKKVEKSIISPNLFEISKAYIEKFGGIKKDTNIVNDTLKEIKERNPEEFNYNGQFDVKDLDTNIGKFMSEKDSDGFVKVNLNENGVTKIIEGTLKMKPGIKTTMVGKASSFVEFQDCVDRLFLYNGNLCFQNEDGDVFDFHTGESFDIDDETPVELINAELTYELRA